MRDDQQNFFRWLTQKPMALLPKMNEKNEKAETIPMKHQLAAKSHFIQTKRERTSREWQEKMRALRRQKKGVKTAQKIDRFLFQWKIYRFVT